MSDDGKVIPLVMVSRQVPYDDGGGLAVMDVVAALEGALEHAREGNFRSVFIAGAYADGSGVWTAWAARSEDCHGQIGMLAALQHDLLRGRK